MLLKPLKHLWIHGLHPPLNTSPSFTIPAAGTAAGSPGKPHQGLSQVLGVFPDAWPHITGHELLVWCFKHKDAFAAIQIFSLGTLSMGVESSLEKVGIASRIFGF